MPEEEDSDHEAEDMPIKTEEVSSKFKRQKKQLVNYVTDLETELIS